MSIKLQNRESSIIQLFKPFIFFTIRPFWQAISVTSLPRGGRAHMSSPSLSSLFYPLLFEYRRPSHACTSRRRRSSISPGRWCWSAAELQLARLAPLPVVELELQLAPPDGRRYRPPAVVQSDLQRLRTLFLVLLSSSALAFSPFSACNGGTERHAVKAHSAAWRDAPSSPRHTSSLRHDVHRSLLPWSSSSSRDGRQRAVRKRWLFGLLAYGISIVEAGGGGCGW